MAESGLSAMRLRFNLWRQRHGPFLPLVSGVLTLLAAAGVLVLLTLGLFWGRPDNPNAFNWWAPISVVVLVLVAREWSRPYFAGIALVVVALLLVLVIELGQNVNHQDQVSNARSTEQGLALILGKSEHVAAATQLKALAFSVTGPANSPPQYATPGDLAPSITALRWDLQRVLAHPLASPHLIKVLNVDQVWVTSALLAARTLPSSAATTTGSSTPPQATVDGSGLSLRWWSYVSDATTSLEHLCRVVGTPPRSSGIPSVCFGDTPTDTDPSPAQMAQAVNPAVSAVFAVVEDVHPTTANASQLATSDKSLLSSFTAAPLSSANIASDLSSGVSELVAYYEVSLPGSSWWYTPLDQGSWIVLAVLFLLGLRLLLILNNRNGWGPIDVALDSADSKTTPDPADLKNLAILRSYVIENMPDPAAAPGSSALSQITTLATATSLGVPWLKPIANFAQWALLPPAGYQILVDFRMKASPGTHEGGAPPDAGAHTPAAKAEADGSAAKAGADAAAAGTGKSSDSGTLDWVRIRIVSRGRSQILEVGKIPDEDDYSTDIDREQAILRSAGYWAAGWILTNCKLVPSWSTWSSDAGEYLGHAVAYSKDQNTKKILDDLRSPEAQAKRTKLIDTALELLSKARRKDTQSGVVLTRLAEQYEYKNDFASALEINLLLVRLYPRYYVARYRASLDLNLMLSSQGKYWDEVVKSRDGRIPRICSLLTEIDACRSSTDVVGNLTLTPGALALPYFSILSAAQLHRGRKLAYAPWMALMAFRKDERSFWLAKLRRPLLIRRNLGSARPSILRSGQLAQARHASDADLRLDGKYKRYLKKPTTAKVERWAESRNESAQVLYNLACFYAVNGREEELELAVGLLEQTQTHRYAQDIHPSWVQRDPDLEWLRQFDAESEVAKRYQAFVALLKGEDWPPEEGADGKVPLVSAPMPPPLTQESSDLPV